MAFTSALGLVQKRSRGLLLQCAVLLALGYTTVPVFLVPSNPVNTQGLQTHAHSVTASAPLVDGLAHFGQGPANRQGQTESHAIGVAEKVVAAMSAGAVAAVVQALLSAVTEPIVNRVLVKRMSVGAAIAELSPSMIAAFFATTISTNLLKFPLFEAVAMFASLMPDMNGLTRGILIGLVFTTSTLPLTNFRYRMSIQTPMAEALKPGVLYQAYLPTVVRDIVYATARNVLTALLLVKFTSLSPASPAMLFAVVLGGCIISAPFNEIRGYLLQSQGKKLTFAEFFKPANFVRSTSLGALNQAIAVATGYWISPMVASLVAATWSALQSGSPVAFLGVVLFMDVLAFVVSRAISKRMRSRRNDDIDGLRKGADEAQDMDIELLMGKMQELERASAKKMKQISTLNEKVAKLGGAA
mmetsp:Transcript_39471/g.86181  ORF Transcript_39471/g.86181 Transcript_39471/m.86181 type:complete len:414 (+) Transcript_39471:52-1293(+)